MGFFQCKENSVVEWVGDNGGNFYVLWLQFINLVDEYMKMS